MQFRESGLPQGTEWSVTTWNPGELGTLPETTSSTNGLLTVAEPGLSSLTDYLVWDCASSVFSGQSCLANSTPASPIELPGTTNVTVSFSPSASAPSGPFPLLVASTGLPNASTPWSVVANGVALPVSGPDELLSLAPGSYVLNGTPVYPMAGTEFVVTGVDVRNLTVGSVWQNATALPARLVLLGPAMVRIVYAERFEVTVVAGRGGVVTPTRPAWTVPGGSVRIGASPLAGYTFVAWSGTGGGAYSGGLADQNVTIYSPVTELAVFQPPAPTFDALTVSESGIPDPVPYTVFLNGTGYTGNGTFTLLLLPGLYGVWVPVGTPENNSLTRYIPDGFQTSGSVQANGDAISVSGSGTLQVEFGIQYGLAILAAGPGTTSPAPGVTWVDAGGSVPLHALPGSDTYFLGWNGTVTGLPRNISVGMDGPASETASFEAIPPPSPRTFDVALEESGLPSGVAWTAIVGGQGLTSPGTITFYGLNGTYAMEVPTFYGSVDVRYVAATGLPTSLLVRSNVTVPVSFVTEYRVTVLAGTGGSAASAPEWAAAGTRVTLSATPNATSTFQNWTGTPYGGTNGSLTITVNGPVRELAAFAPTAPGAAAGLSPLLWAVPAALFVVGLLAVLLFARRRSA
jgi:hypothetical protein